MSGLMTRRKRYCGTSRRGVILVATSLVIACSVALVMLFGGGGSSTAFLIKPSYANSVKHIWSKSFVAFADLYEGKDVMELPSEMPRFDPDDEAERPFEELAQAVSKNLSNRIFRELSARRKHKGSPLLILYLTTEALPDFALRHLPILESEFDTNEPTKLVLVSGCTDPGPVEVFRRWLVAHSSKSERKHLGTQRGEAENAVKRLAESPLIHRWFAQNCDLNHDKIRCLPIGFDFHTLSKKKTSWGAMQSAEEQDAELTARSDIASSPFHIGTYKDADGQRWLRSRSTKMVMDFSSHSNKMLRGQLYVQFYPKSFTRVPMSSMTRKDLWQMYSEVSFVLSPPGNGYDCHRTWEALGMGAVPIILSASVANGESGSSGDSIFEKLPVVTVESYDEVTEEMLEAWRRRIVADALAGKYDVARMTNSFWLRRIREAALETQ